jgi:fatty acid desaturase
VKVLSQINDPVYKKKDTYTFLDKFFLNLIRDPRDLPFAYLTLQISLTMIPLGILLYFPFITGWVWWMLASVYLLINNLYFKGSFGLMLHCTCHNKLYKKKYDLLNQYLPWFVGLFFGQTPDTYFSHHIGMHHPENNLPEDKSSTMFYQRDSFRSFMAYFTNFLFVGIFQLSEYFIKKNRKRLLVNTLRGEIFFFLLCAVLSVFNWPATLVVFILPFLISRFIMMLGNWTQHAFIDPLEPGNPYKNSITCINIKYNKKCWNDGYHISHHIRPSMHWTEHPIFFLKNKKEYTKNRAIVFDGIDFLGVFYYLMTKRYDILAKNFVNIDNTYRSQEEVISLLKTRTRRIPKTAMA